MCRFIGKTNAILCDFGCCDGSTLVHRTFCMDLYDCELWNISSKYTEEMRKIWKLHPRTHNLIYNIRSNFTHSLEKYIFRSCIMPCITQMNWSDYYYMLS